MSLNNKIVLITGASSGIGAACAETFAKAGTRLLLCARNVEALNTLSARLKEEYGTESKVFQLDVRDPVVICNMFDSLPLEWQTVDILINNAGLAAGLDFLQEGNVEDWEAMIDTNIKGLLYVSRKFLPNMIRNNQGHIINIGSISSHEVYPKGAVYCATKFAVRALTQGLRMDLMGTKLRVTSIDPGAVETNFSVVRFKGDEKRAAAVYQDMTPLHAHDIADAALFTATRPPHVNISEMIIMPTDQVSVTMVSRNKKGEGKRGE